MSLIWRSIVALSVVLLFVFIVGYLEFRAAMLALGLNLTWDLEPLSVTTPETAYGELLALFIVFGLVAWLFLAQRRSVSGASGIPPLVGGVALLAVIGWQMVTVTPEVVMPVELNDPTQEGGWWQALESRGPEFCHDRNDRIAVGRGYPALYPGTQYPGGVVNPQLISATAVEVCGPSPQRDWRASKSCARSVTWSFATRLCERASNRSSHTRCSALQQLHVVGVVTHYDE